MAVIGAETTSHRAVAGISMTVEGLIGEILTLSGMATRAITGS
jgi:hypothetical protein